MTSSPISETGHTASHPRRALITGGAGFVGTNLAHALLSRGAEVSILDNMFRPGVERNFNWLKQKYGDSVILHHADIRDRKAVDKAVRNVDAVFHLAAQVAVTTSLEDPTEDFMVNLGGTVNLLESLRSMNSPPSLVYTSTNKVYGNLDDISLVRSGDRYEPRDYDLRRKGIGEWRPLDFHSPYGCSKGGADQYVLDYARNYDLHAVVFRMSCIYGPHQMGTEDQGWVAHFLIRAMQGMPITLYGDGYQVRDILFVEDLVRALLLASDPAMHLSGRAFTIGGGTENAVSLAEVIRKIEKIAELSIEILPSEWRPADQKYFVADTSAFRDATGWSPIVGVNSGLKRLYAWLRSQQLEGYDFAGTLKAKENAACTPA